MMRRLEIWLLCGILAVGSAMAHGQGAAPSSADLTGTWQGTTTVTDPNATGTRIEMKVTKDGAQGAPYKGTLYMPDMGLNGRAMAAPAINLHGPQISFRFRRWGAA